MSVTGHQTEQMVSRYTKKANQKLMAGDAMKKLEEGRALVCGPEAERKLSF
jgi:hypothetical protein